jgi:hypothetical protein
MKPNFSFILSFVGMAFIAILVIFCLNKIMAILYGYNPNLIDSTNAESFQLYKEIYGPKIMVIVVSTILSVFKLLLPGESCYTSRVLSIG